MGRFAAFRERRRAARNTRKCDECGTRVARDAMRLAHVEVQKRYPLPILFLRNLGGLVLGYKPEHKSVRRYLFGHGFMELNRKTVKRWLCFNCFIQVLTPKEYELFREAYFDDAVVEDGRERAAERLADMDAVFAAREEVTQ